MSAVKLYASLFAGDPNPELLGECKNIEYTLNHNPTYSYGVLTKSDPKGELTLRDIDQSAIHTVAVVTRARAWSDEDEV